MFKNYQYIQESKKPGKRIEELVKGSLDYERYEIESAFRAQFPDTETGYYTVWESFADHVIVSERVFQPNDSVRNPLHVDEYFRVDFTRAGESITFSPREQWSVVELTYQPKTMQESIWMIESALTAKDGVKKIQIKRLMTADVINGNNRLYPANVLRAAVEDIRGHLHESAGQGRLMLLGEVEHPSDKGGRRASLMETVIRWTDVEFDGQYVNATGLLATDTDGGRHIQALTAIGVVPGGSIRGYGLTETVKSGDRVYERVNDLRFTGIDIVTEPSFSDSQTLIESMGSESPAEEKKMNLLEKLIALLKARPDLFSKGVSEATLRAMTESQLEGLWAKVEEAMGIDISQINVAEAMADMSKKARLFEESQRQAVIETAIAEATKDLPYGDDFNTAFVDGIRNAKPQDADAVKALVEAKRAEYDKLFADRSLASRGFSGRISGVAPVIEAETGTPEFARGSFLLAEAIRRENHNHRTDFRKPRTINESVTARILEKFDSDNRHHLMLESRLLQEAGTTADLNLPYSVSRAIVEEAFPSLVALGVFDVDTTDQSPTKIFYERFVGETGFTGSISADEVVTIVALDTWYALANKRITPGTMVVKNEAETATYDYGSDFVVDYANGRIKALSGGDIEAGDVLHITAYSYTAVRKGENVGIERGKLQLESKTMEIAADRLAEEITREAIVFGRSQLGWDAVGRTLDSLVKQIRRRVDNGLIYMSLSAVLSVANNSGGTWTAATDTLDALVQKLGTARVKVNNRQYEPTAYMSSMTNVEKLSHWSGFTAAGQRPGDERMGNGFAGSVNGLPVFMSTEHPDGYFQVINRQLVQHRIFQAMLVKGPYPSYDSNMHLKANDQYYIEEFNGSDAPVPEKGAYVVVA